MAFDAPTTTTRLLTVHRIALDPTPQQDEIFARCAGIARFAWNWGLARWKEQYAAHRADPTLPKPSWVSLNRDLNAVKRVQFPWMMQVSKVAPQAAIRNLGVAFNAFFSGRAKYPTFKVKGKCRAAFKADDGPGTFRVDGRRIKLPKIGWVRMHEALRYGADLNPELRSVTISREAGRWFASVLVAIDHTVPVWRETKTVGVDLGVSHLATLSSGEKVEGQKALRGNLKKLARLQRSHARKQKGGKNRVKSRAKVAKLYARIKNIRQDCLHKLTTKLARNHSDVVIEDLNVKGMMKNRHLSRAISDMGFFEFRRQLTYKLARLGGRLIVADRFFASSKTCSCCGNKAEVLPLSVRDWTCAHCGAQHDRDVNAAINLRNLAGSEGSDARPVTACGVEGSGGGSDPAVKPATVKQEMTSDTMCHAL